MKKLLFILAGVAILLSGCQRECPTCIDNYPDASFYVSTSYVETETDVLFTNTSSNADQIEWDFGDGTYSQKYNTVHFYTKPGIYKTSLTVYSNNYSDKAYQTITVEYSTDMEVTVLEYFDKYPIFDASVILYENYDDWVNESNFVVEGFTDKNGRVVFTHLQDIEYFVDVWEKNHNNFTLADEDIGFIATGRLFPHEYNLFTAYVDYAPQQKSTGRNRSSILPLKGRVAGTNLTKKERVK